MSGIRRTLDGVSLSKKFFWSFFVLFAIPIIFGAWLYMVNVRQGALRENVERNDRDVRQIKNDALKNMTICKAAGDFAISADRGRFLEILSRDTDVTAESMLSLRRELLPNIENIMSINLSINKVRVFCANENLYEIYPVLRHESLISSQSWHGEILAANGGLFWRMNHFEDDFSLSSHGALTVVSQYREIRYNRNHIGVVEVNMRAGDFFGSIYADLSNAVSFTCVIDGGGREYWNEKSAFFADYTINPPDLKEALLEKTSGAEGNFTIRRGGVNLAVSYVKIPAMNITLCQVMSLSLTDRQLVRQQAVFAGILIFFTSAYGVFVFLLSRALTGKTRAIVSCMRKVQDGDLFVEIPDQGGDEIGEIGWHFRIMLDKINDLIFTVTQKQALAREAEIKSLRSRINAHFIYNVLETIKMMAVIDYKYDIADAITIFGNMLRYGIDWKNRFTTLREEIRHVENYVSLLNMRFNNSIKLIIDVPSEYDGIRVLKMILQPVAENAVKHGLEPKGGGVVSVAAAVTGNTLRVDVTDDGVGFTSCSLEDIRLALETGRELNSSGDGGIGLSNVQERIRLQCGAGYGITLERLEDAYTKVSVTVPASPNEKTGA